MLSSSVPVFGLMSLNRLFPTTRVDPGGLERATSAYGRLLKAVTLSRMLLISCRCSTTNATSCSLDASSRTPRWTPIT